MCWATGNGAAGSFRRQATVVFLSMVLGGLVGSAWCGLDLVDLGDFTSEPIVGPFGAEYVRLLKDRDYAGAASQTLHLLAQYPGNPTVQIVGQYLWAVATLNTAHFTAEPLEQKQMAQRALTGLERCTALIKKLPVEERQRGYARLEQRLIPLHIIAAADLAGSHTEVLRLGEAFMAHDPDSTDSILVLAPMIRSFWRTRADDGATSYLERLAVRFKHRRVASAILFDLGTRYLKKGRRDLLLSVIKTMEADFPGENIYKQALQRLAVEGAAGRRLIPPKKDTSTTTRSSQTDPPAGCGCGCGSTTATPPASARATSGTVAGLCCTTGCVTTTVAGTIKRP